MKTKESECGININSSPILRSKKVLRAKLLTSRLARQTSDSCDKSKHAAQTNKYKTKGRTGLSTTSEAFLKLKKDKNHQKAKNSK